MTLQALAVDALRRDPTSTALDFDGRSYSWSEMARVADGLSRLIAESGADSAGSVGLIGRNRPSALAALLGLIAEGRSVKMIYPFQSPASLADNISRLEFSVAVAAIEDFTEPVVVELRRRGIAAIGLSEMQAVAIEGMNRTTAAEDLSSCARRIEVLTSGTTGTPKQFPFTYDYVAEHIVGLQLDDPNDAIRRAIPNLLYFPIGNISGLKGTLPALLGGRAIILLERFSLASWLDYVRKFRPAETSLPPAGIQMILDAKVASEYLASISVIRTGAAPLATSAHRAFEETYGIPIILSYGATEFGGQVTTMSSDLLAEWGDRKLGSVGRAGKGVELRVVDAATDAILGPGEEGLLEVFAPRINPDWIRTSDLVVLDEDGFLFHRGRSDGAIIRGGFKILPATIERALLTHPAVAEAVAFGVPDRRLGEVPVVTFQVRAGEQVPSASELEAHLRAHLLATHVPVAWKAIEKMPRTASMKIDRPAVRALFEQEFAEGGPAGKPSPRS